MGHLGPRLEINWKIIRSHIRKKTSQTSLPRYPPATPFRCDALSQACVETADRPAGGRGGRTPQPQHDVAVPTVGRAAHPCAPPLILARSTGPSCPPASSDTAARRGPEAFLPPVPGPGLAPGLPGLAPGCLALLPGWASLSLPESRSQAGGHRSAHLGEVSRWGLRKEGREGGQPPSRGEAWLAQPLPPAPWGSHGKTGHLAGAASRTPLSESQDSAAPSPELQSEGSRWLLGPPAPRSPSDGSSLGVS